MNLLKKTDILFLVALLSLTFSCSNKIIPTSKVNYLSGSNGTITMRAIGNGSNQSDAIFDAEKNAFDVLLFRGLPESEQRIALIGSNELEEVEKHKEYFKNFYSQKRYKSFLMASITASSFAKQNGGVKGITMEMKINLIALRKDLEQYNIIRRFGF